MKDVVEHVAKALVDHPHAVVVHEEASGDEVTLRLTVHPDDMGKVIGRQGRIAKAIRNVASAAAYRQNKHVVVHIDS